MADGRSLDDIIRSRAQAGTGDKGSSRPQPVLTPPPSFSSPPTQQQQQGMRGPGASKPVFTKSATGVTFSGGPLPTPKPQVQPYGLGMGQNMLPQLGGSLGLGSFGLGGLGGFPGQTGMTFGLVQPLMGTVSASNIGGATKHALAVLESARNLAGMLEKMGHVSPQLLTLKQQMSTLDERNPSFQDRAMSLSEQVSQLAKNAGAAPISSTPVSFGTGNAGGPKTFVRVADSAEKRVIALGGGGSTGGSGGGVARGSVRDSGLSFAAGVQSRAADARTLRASNRSDLLNRLRAHVSPASAPASSGKIVRDHTRDAPTELEIQGRTKIPLKLRFDQLRGLV